VGELDLLGIRHKTGTTVTGWHVEVQASFRPIRYIAMLTSDMARELNKSRTAAIKRTPEQIEACAREWVRWKFCAEDKVQVRERLWPGVAWSYHLVHAVVREPQELKVFQQEGVTCHPLHDLLAHLSRRADHAFSGSAGGDRAEIVATIIPPKPRSRSTRLNNRRFSRTYPLSDKWPKRVVLRRRSGEHGIDRHVITIIALYSLGRSSCGRV
jgi:hypothetical protein